MKATLPLAALFVLACGKPAIVPRGAPGAVQASITVTSPSFGEGGSIPVDHTCDGSEAMPELVLSSPPEGTKSLVVLVDDPDAPGGSFVHMVAFNIAPDIRKLGAEISTGGENARYGLNDFAAPRYGGPCPPKGEMHRYRFRVIAVNTMLKLGEGATKGQIDEAIDGHILGEGVLTGHFGH